MKKMICVAIALAFCLSTANLSQAAVTDVMVMPVDNSAGGTALDGFVTNDIKISFTGQYTGAQILLDSGAADGIYQNAFGSKIPPNAGFFGGFPALEFDTFVAQGSAIAGGPFGEPAPGGGAVDLGADAVSRFETDLLNQAFNPAGGNEILDQNNFLIARITLRADVSGAALLLASAGGERLELPGTVLNGSISFDPDPIPEPSSLILGSFGILSIFGLRRRG